MMAGGDAAEQVVRLSLEGIEVAAKITGEGAKNLALILAAVIKEEQKTKGKARLSNMIKSGKELKVFSIQNKDLKKFSQEAKRYGVLYCVLKDKDNKSDTATVDIIARAEDASKIQRIVERFELSSVDKASIVNEVNRDRSKTDKTRSDIDKILDDVLAGDEGGERQRVNPSSAKTEKSPLSKPDSSRVDRSEDSKKDRPSVKGKLEGYKKDIDKKKSKERGRGDVSAKGNRSSGAPVKRTTKERGR